MPKKGEHPIKKSKGLEKIRTKTYRYDGAPYNAE